MRLDPEITAGSFRCQKPFIHKIWSAGILSLRMPKVVPPFWAICPYKSSATQQQMTRQQENSYPVTARLSLWWGRPVCVEFSNTCWSQIPDKRQMNSVWPVHNEHLANRWRETNKKPKFIYLNQNSEIPISNNAHHNPQIPTSQPDF